MPADFRVDSNLQNAIREAEQLALSILNINKAAVESIKLFGVLDYGLDLSKN